MVLSDLVKAPERRWRQRKRDNKDDKLNQSFAGASLRTQILKIEYHTYYLAQEKSKGEWM